MTFKYKQILHFDTGQPSCKRGDPAEIKTGLVSGTGGGHAGGNHGDDGRQMTGQGSKAAGGNDISRKYE